MQPRILVGCPTSFHKEYCLKKYADAVKGLTYKNHDVLLIDNSPEDDYFKKIKEAGLPVIKGPYFESARDRIVASRNILRKKVLEENYDFFLSLEQDVIQPADIIENLLQHKKEVISAVYFMPHINGLIPMLGIRGKEKYSYLQFDMVDKSNELMQVDYAGMGVILISKKVLEKINFRTDEKPGFDDWFFCKDVEKEGFKIFADLSIKCKHLLKNRPWSWKDIKL